MKMANKASQKTFAITGALVAWAAVVSQFYLILKNATAPTSETIIRFFSFFTILTNIMVALAFTAAIANKPSFFTKAKTLTAIAVYITIVGLTYNIILRGIWAPQGLQRIVDEGLHVIVPLLFILYWFLFVPKEKLSWGNALTWLIYPGIYLVYIFIRGNFSNWYPYPFIDVATLGYNKALINSAMVCAAFIIVALVFIAIARSASSKTQ